MARKRGKKTGNSISDFSRSYPDGGKQKDYDEQRRNRKFLAGFLSAVGLIVVIIAGFFIMDVFLNVADEPPTAPETSNAEGSGTAITTEPPTTEAPKPAVQEIHAVTLDPAALGGGNALQRAIQDAQAQKANCVLLDFKEEGGKFNYPTKREETKETEMAVQVYPKTQESIKALQAAGLKVIARVYCFQDAPMARKFSDMAVTYRDQGVLWHDNALNAGGQPWLNPYSSKAQEYVLSVVQEVLAFQPDYLLLDGVRFAKGYVADATFTGEYFPGALPRNALLLDFVDRVQKQAGKTAILCAMDYEAAFSEEPSVYYDGNLWGCQVAGFVIPMTQTQLKEKKTTPAGKEWMPLTDKATPSGAYIVT